MRCEIYETKWKSSGYHLLQILGKTTKNKKHTFCNIQAFNTLYYTGCRVFSSGNTQSTMVLFSVVFAESDVYHFCQLTETCAFYFRRLLEWHLHI